MTHYDHLRFRARQFSITLIGQEGKVATWRARAYFFTSVGDCPQEYTGIGSTPEEALDSLVSFAAEQKDPIRF